jgi:hypothetical protein
MGYSEEHMLTFVYSEIWDHRIDDLTSAHGIGRIKTQSSKFARRDVLLVILVSGSCIPGDMSTLPLILLEEISNCFLENIVQGSVQIHGKMFCGFHEVFIQPCGYDCSLGHGQSSYGSLGAGYMLFIFLSRWKQLDIDRKITYM